LNVESCSSDHRLHATETVLNPCKAFGERDPIVVWPDTEPRLRTIIADLQRLNPALGLRCAVEHREPHDETYLLIDTAGNRVRETKKQALQTLEFLVYEGHGLEVLTLSMPQPITDSLYHAICSANSRYLQRYTDLGVFNVGPRRIDRIKPEELQFRPQSKCVQAALIAFTAACQRPTDMGDVAVDGPQIKGPWGLYVEDQIWTVDFACLPPRHQLDEDGRPKKYPEWLRTPLIGAISYVDRHDLPIEDHLLRARVMLVLGCSFAVIADIERGNLHIHQMSDTVVSESVRLPHLCWFDIPVSRRT
jgi:hypothetical protein